MAGFGIIGNGITTFLASENAAATPVLWPFENGKRYERALNFGGILCSEKPFGSDASKKYMCMSYTWS